MDEDNKVVVNQHVEAHGVKCLKQPNGELVFPYIVPAGPYTQLWDWDAVFTGVGLLPLGSRDFLLGSMKNLLHRVSADGRVPGCLTPNGPSKTLYQAKPVVVQGAWLASKGTEQVHELHQFVDAMANLLQYWDDTRKDAATGLYVWYDQMESGADNLVLSDPLNDKLNTCCTDVMVFLFREHTAMALFLEAWADRREDDAAAMRARAAVHRAKAEAIKEATFAHLWQEAEGYFCAFNVKTQQVVKNRTFLMAFPLWEPAFVADRPDVVERVVAELRKPDMLCEFGVRSTSSADKLYNNANIITPFSNWQGPVWICSNAILAYALSHYPSAQPLAREIASKVVTLLANDLRDTKEWHECYDSETGKGLAAPGFLSWNVLAYNLEANIANQVNPTRL